MNREELEEHYEAGNLDDVTELQRLRDEIYQYTGLTVPRSAADVEEWWRRKKSVFSRRVKPSELSEAASDKEDNQGESE